jgi:hypothetical protein
MLTQTPNGFKHDLLDDGERPANPILPARALGIVFAGHAWRIERRTRMTEGSGEPGYSARLPALAGRRGRVILGRNSSFH